MTDQEKRVLKIAMVYVTADAKKKHGLDDTAILAAQMAFGNQLGLSPEEVVALGKAARAAAHAGGSNQGQKAAAIIHPIGKAVLGYFGADNQVSEDFAHHTTVETVNAPGSVANAAGEKLRGARDKFDHILGF